MTHLKPPRFLITASSLLPTIRLFYSRQLIVDLALTINAKFNQRAKTFTKDPL